MGKKNDDTSNQNTLDEKNMKSNEEQKNTKSNESVLVDSDTIQVEGLEKGISKYEDKKATVSNKAVSQSKRLADAKEAEEKKKEEQKKEGNKKEKTKKDKQKTEEDKIETEDKKDTPKPIEETQTYVVNEQPKKKKGPLIGLCVILGMLLIAYISGFVYFSNYFYLDAAINGVDVSNMDAANAKLTLDTFYNGYTLTMHTVDNEDVVLNGKDIDMVITPADEFKTCIKNQKAYAWFIEVWKHHDNNITATATWNQNKLDDIYKNMKILSHSETTEPVDAYIGIEKDKIAIIPEVMGNRLDTKTFKNVVETQLQTVQAKVDLKEKNCYEVPKVYSDSKELNDDYTALGEYTNCIITLQLDDLTLEPGYELLSSVLEKQGGKYVVSKDKVKKYVSDLAREYDTYGETRVFESVSFHKTVSVKGVNFGYKMDQDKTAEALTKALEEKKSATVDAEFVNKGKSLAADNDWGDTYIEANLTQQKVFAYKDGKKIAESDCVSGNISAGHGTCLGLYAIQLKQSPATLRGDMVPKETKEIVPDENGNPVEVVTTTMEYSYESQVTYWMPFNGGYGLHDADGWRSSYGGSIYYYSGSHGCINLPRTFAKTLYENFDVGTPVLVYYEDGEAKKPE